MQPTWEKQFTVFALDLPYHGQTQWPYAEFTLADMEQIIRKVVDHLGHSTCSLLGFSFGARMAVCLLPHLHDVCTTLLLLSPDGLNTRGMLLVTHLPKAWRRWLQQLTEKPAVVQTICRSATLLRPLAPTACAFIHRHMADPRRRQRAFGCWQSLLHFNLNPSLAHQILARYPCPVILIFGKNDPLIQKRNIRKLANSVGHLTCIPLPCGHHLPATLLAPTFDTLYRTMSPENSKKHNARVDPSKTAYEL